LNASLSSFFAARALLCITTQAGQLTGWAICQTSTDSMRSRHRASPASSAIEVMQCQPQRHQHRIGDVVRQVQ
jgi:hypothetical protein